MKATLRHGQSQSGVAGRVRGITREALHTHMHRA